MNDIGEILHTADQGVSPCPLARRLIQQRLEEDEKSFRDTAQLQQRMLKALVTWSQKPGRRSTGDMSFHLLAGFDNATLS